MTATRRPGRKLSSAQEIRYWTARAAELRAAGDGKGARNAENRVRYFTRVLEARRAARAAR
jgi:hypothetical protein